MNRNGFHLPVLLVFPIFLLAARPLIPETIVRVGGYTYPPFIGKDESGSYSGLTLDLLELLNGIDSGYRFLFVPTSPNRRYRDAEAGLYDIIFFERTEWGWSERGIPTTVSGVLFQDSQVFLARRHPDRGQEYFDDFEGKRLLGILGYHYRFAGGVTDPDALERTFGMGTVNDQTAVVQAVLSQRADIGIVNETFLRGYLVRHPEAAELLLVSDRCDDIHPLRILFMEHAPIGPRTLESLLLRLERETAIERLLSRYPACAPLSGSGGIGSRRGARGADPSGSARAMKSFQRDFLLRALLGVLSLLAIWLTLTFIREARQSEEEMQRFSELSAHELARSLADPLWAYDFALTGTILRSKLEHPAVRALLLRTEDNEVMGYAAQPGQTRPLLLREEPSWSRPSVTVPITYRDSEIERTIGSVTVFPRQEYFRTRIGRNVLQDFGALFLALLALLAFLSGPLVKLFRRLHRLSETAGTIARGDHSLRLAVHDDDEISEIEDAVNRMAGSLTQSSAFLHQEREDRIRAEEARDRDRQAMETETGETRRLLESLGRAVRDSSEAVRDAMNALSRESESEQVRREAGRARETAERQLEIGLGLFRYLGQDPDADTADAFPVRPLDLRRFFRQTAAPIRRKAVREGGRLQLTVDRTVPEDLLLDGPGIRYLLEAISGLLLAECAGGAPVLKLHVAAERTSPSGQSVDLSITLLRQDCGSQTASRGRKKREERRRTEDDPVGKDLTLLLGRKILQNAGGDLVAAEEESDSIGYSFVFRGLIIPPPRGITPAEGSLPADPPASHDPD